MGKAGRITLLWAALAVSGDMARAELPQIRLDRIFPLGAEAGGGVEVEIEGRDLDDARTLRFDRPGFRADRVKPNRFRVHIDGDVPPGAYDLRVVGAFGLSGGRLFSVARGLTEVVETEPNDAPESAQVVAMNAAINGRSDGNGDDFFRFPAKKGARVTVDAWAFRLDSTMRPVTVLSDASGKELARGKPYYDRTDPLIDLVVPIDGPVVLRIHDSTFQGGLPYRVIVSDRPQVENAFPCAVAPGETAELTVLGRNLPGGRPAPEFPVLGLPLDRLTVAFTAPPDVPGGFAFSTPLPAPSLNARGWQVWPKAIGEALGPVTLAAATDPVTLEREPNDSAGAAQALKLPTVVCGRFERPRDSDWYEFSAKQGETVAVDLLCERLDFPGDPRVVVTDDKGAELAAVDDHGIRFNALDLYNRDPQGLFTAPKDGRYRLLVQETYLNGSARYLYALRVGKPLPDFFPVAFHETRDEPTCPLVRRGGSAFVELCVNRRDGFEGLVTVEAEGLPPGLTCPTVHVSPQSPFGLAVFTASADAPEWSGAVRLKARATIAGKPVDRAVGCSQRRWALNNVSASRACREIGVAVRPSAPYGLTTAAGPLTVAAGATLKTTARVTRHWPEFTGPVVLNGLDLPPGFGVATTELPSGKTEAPFSVTVASNVPPGPYTVVLRGDAQAPYRRDPKAPSSINVRVADPSTPLTVVVTAAAKP